MEGQREKSANVRGQVGFEVFIEASMKMSVFWSIRVMDLMMEAGRTSETLVNICQATHCRSLLR
jgi:hypothetical protein